MFTETQAARDLFESHVPHADATFLVVKAHLVLEAALVKFIAARLPLSLAKEVVESRELGFPAKILFARALASRDDVPIESEDILWPALKQLNGLRNKLAHNLTLEGSKVEHSMRGFIRIVDPDGELFGTEWNEDHLFFIFRESANRLNALLAIVRTPIHFSDIDLDNDA